MYYIQIISFDLRHEETIIQAINTLDYLQVAIDNAFDKIDKRIADNNKKIQTVQSRINIAANKVRKLSRANKAIKILAPAKFPASNALEDISATFNVLPGSFSQLILDYDFEDTQAHNHNAFQNKLVFFHVKNQRKRYALSNVLFDKYDVGFIPNYLKFVNSVLLFNVFQNMYDFKHSSTRNFLSSQNKPDVGCKIVAAPISITNRQISDKFNVDLLYMPKLNGAPHINLPLDLPDLPGIADDVQFESKEEPKIAPSLYIEKYIPMETVCPMPKPPPASPILIETEKKCDKPTNMKVVHVPTTQPPPPPLPPMPPNIMNVNISNTTTQNTDARSSLMDAIRKAGGAMGGKLRGVVEPQKEIAAKENKNTANNLLDDLHNKLLMRRKGISGTKPKNESVIERLSELMPPPPIQQKDSSPDSTDNDEWD